MSELQAKSTNTLALCPFCGGEAVKLTSIDGFTSIGCLNCNPFYGVMIQATTEAEAIAAWNSRADYHGYEQAAIEAWESIKAWNSRAEHGTLTAEQVRKAAKSNSRIYKSPVDDGIWIKEYDWQAIADELNSRAERTCKIESSHLNDFTNKYECWYEFEMQCGYKFTWDEMEPPTYCPNCGRKCI